MKTLKYRPNKYMDELVRCLDPELIEEIVRSEMFYSYAHASCPKERKAAKRMYNYYSKHEDQI